MSHQHTDVGPALAESHRTKIRGLRRRGRHEGLMVSRHHRNEEHGAARQPGFLQRIGRSFVSRTDDD